MAKNKQGPLDSSVKPSKKKRLNRVDTNKAKNQVKKWQDKNKGAFQ